MSTLSFVILPIWPQLKFQHVFRPSQEEMSKLGSLAKQIFDIAVIQIFTSWNKIWLRSSSGKSTGKLLKSASLFSVFCGTVM